jgi:putative colanic acid biosynthesis acetyltransferase WcaF
MSILDAKRYNTLAIGRSFSIANLIYRTTWQLVWLLLASWTPPPLHCWRRLLLRLFGAKIAKGAHIYGSARIWSPANLEMGCHACLGRRVNCYSMAKITVGPYAVISQGAHLCAGSHDINDENFQLVARPVEIGPHAWIATEAFVGPGVTVGEGAVLGARGVTFKDLADYTVYVGNPAEAIKQRSKSYGGKTPDDPQAQ